MRAILRFSLNGDKNSLLRNRLVAILENRGFKGEPGSSNTSTWQNHDTSNANYGDAICELWDEIKSHQGPGDIDNFWAYNDQWSYPDDIDEQLNELGVK